MFKKRLLIILFLVLGLFTFAACKEKEKEKENVPPDPVYLNYTIKVYDLDGEELANKAYSTKDYDTVLKAIKEDLNAVCYDTQYGTSVSSIKGSIVDANWYLALYENNEYASTGVDGLVIDDGDVFEFKSECWNTVASGYGAFDETDVLLDKVLYSYMKKYFAEVVKGSLDLATGDYWSMMMVYMMSSNGYDANVFNTKAFKEEYKTALTNTDLSTLEGAAWGKYFYAARAFGLNLDAFKTAYTAYMTNTVTEAEVYSEWSTPFYLSPAKYLEVETASVTALKNTEYRAGTEWGLDGWCWQMTNLSLWNTYTLADLSNIAAADQGNGCSTALMLLPLAANNISARTVKNDAGKDLLQLVLAYYDESLGLVKWSKEDTGINYSTNQIYASLMAYKAQRDLGKAVNIFA